MFDIAVVTNPRLYLLCAFIRGPCGLIYRNVTTIAGDRWGRHAHKRSQASAMLFANMVGRGLLTSDTGK